MKRLIRYIKTYRQRKRQKSLNDFLETHYNVTVKNGSLFIVCGENPIIEVPTASTVYDMLKQLRAVKDSFKSYNK